MLFSCTKNNSLPYDKIIVEKVHVSKDEHTVYVDYKHKKNVVLDSDEELFFSILDITEDKNWIIVNVIHVDSMGPGQVSTFNFFYNTKLRTKIEPSFLDKEYGSYNISFEKISNEYYIEGIYWKYAGSDMTKLKDVLFKITNKKYKEKNVDGSE